MPYTRTVILRTELRERRRVRGRTERKKTARYLPDGYTDRPRDDGDGGEKVGHECDGKVASIGRPARPRERDARAREGHAPLTPRRLPRVLPRGREQPRVEEHAVPSLHGHQLVGQRSFQMRVDRVGSAGPRRVDRARVEERAHGDAVEELGRDQLHRADVPRLPQRPGFAPSLDDFAHRLEPRVGDWSIGVDGIRERFRDVSPDELGVASLQRAEVREREHREPRGHRRPRALRLHPGVVLERGARAFLVLAGEPGSFWGIGKFAAVGGADLGGGAHLGRGVGHEGVVQPAYFGRREGGVGVGRGQHLIARPALEGGVEAMMVSFGLMIRARFWRWGGAGRRARDRGGLRGRGSPSIRAQDVRLHVLSRASPSPIGPPPSRPRPSSGATTALGVAKTRLPRWLIARDNKTEL